MSRVRVFTAIAILLTAAVLGLTLASEAMHAVPKSAGASPWIAIAGLGLMVTGAYQVRIARRRALEF